MPFVTLAADARGAGYGAVYIDDDAWSRWAEAMSALVLAGMVHGYVRMHVAP